MTPERLKDAMSGHHFPLHEETCSRCGITVTQIATSNGLLFSCEQLADLKKPMEERRDRDQD